MIQTSLTNLIVLILVAALALIGLSWIVKVWRQRRHEKRVLQHRVICAVCGNVFEETTRREVVTCPACGRLNERQEVLDL